MRLLVNENVSATVIQALRQRGHDVLSAKESMRGESDSAVLLRARQEGRLVVTHDKDFGELAFRNCLPAECGILLFRLGGADPDSDNRRMLEVIQGRQDWAGHFAVVTDDQIRIRLLPPAKSGR
jgi:predicted nuclease of predicted toxin-antitoxin system